MKARADAGYCCDCHCCWCWCSYNVFIGRYKLKFSFLFFIWSVGLFVARTDCWWMLSACVRQLWSVGECGVGANVSVRCVFVCLLCYYYSWFKRNVFRHIGVHTRTHIGFDPKNHWGNNDNGFVTFFLLSVFHAHLGATTFRCPLSQCTYTCRI